MARTALPAMLLAIALVGRAAAQQGSPFELPTPLGGPIRSPSGQIINGIDKAPSPWDIGVEAGLSGSSGNVDIFKALVGGDVRYDDPSNVLRANGLYILTASDGWSIEQKGFLTARDEIPVLDWLSYYAQGQLEYDQFRTIDWRLAAHNGVSYTALNSGQLLFKVRGGIGTAREWGGPSPPWVTEAQFGGDLEYKITARTMFVAAFDYYPDIKYFGNYRLRGASLARHRVGSGIEPVPSPGRDGSVRQHPVLLAEKRHRLLWHFDVSVLANGARTQLRAESINYAGIVSLPVRLQLVDTMARGRFFCFSPCIAC